MADRRLLTPSGSAVILGDDEVRLIRLLAEGLTLEAISRRCNVSERTLRRRTRTLCERVGVDSVIQLAVWAARTGVV